MPGQAARPVNPVPLTEKDLYAACRDFVLAYALPPVKPERIFMGGSAQEGPSPEPEPYVVIRIGSSTSCGRSVETFTAVAADPNILGTLTVKTLMAVSVQIECWAPPEIARLQAERLITVARSSVGTQFFTDRGMSCPYADETREDYTCQPNTGPLQCFSALLRVSHWSCISMGMPYFDKASIARLENVDVHHPVTKEQ